MIREQRSTSCTPHSSGSWQLAAVKHSSSQLSSHVKLPWQSKLGHSDERELELQGCDDDDQGMVNILVDTILTDESLSEVEQRDALDQLLARAASTGDVDCVTAILDTPAARGMVDVNRADDQGGSTPLIQAACFGHEDLARLLLNAGADPNAQDRSKWTALTWASNNGNDNMVRLLIAYGANQEIKTASGLRALDFGGTGGNRDEGIGSAGVLDDWYSKGFGDDDQIEVHMEEAERHRRMMMESSFNLEVDLSSLGLDTAEPESNAAAAANDNGDNDFIWDRCLPSQMFVCSEDDIDMVLDMGITKFKPQQRAMQKPIPANLIFLSARYANNTGSVSLLERVFDLAFDKTRRVVEQGKQDLAVLTFWLFNLLLLLYYLRKDTGLSTATIEQQHVLAELMQDIYILVIRDAERRLGKALDESLLDSETISGLEGLHFQNEWRLFRSRTTHVPSGKQANKTSPRRRPEPSPRNITSLLSSVQYIFEIFEIHSIITQQALSQLLAWIGSETFNHILSNKAYLKRSKALQIRLNMSYLEDWVRINLSPDSIHFEIARQSLHPTIQLLQWLQCLSSLDDDMETFTKTIASLDLLTPQQMLKAADDYRAEVGEAHLSSKFRQILLQPKPAELEVVDLNPEQHKAPARQHSPVHDNDSSKVYKASENVTPFAVPTLAELITAYGSGIGGVDRERERKFSPALPPEFLEAVDLATARQSSPHDNVNSSRADTQWNDY